MKNKFIVYGFIVLFAACASKPLAAAKLKTEPKQTAPVVVNANDRLSEIINPVNSTDVVSGIAEVESIENNIISGKKIYDNCCGKCHKLFDPKEFSKSEWVPILKRMQRKAHLSDIEIAEIAGFINNEI